MKIRVIVLYADSLGYDMAKDGNYMDANGFVFREYTMDHNDPAQRRVLGEQVRNAFEAGQCVITYPVAS